MKPRVVVVGSFVQDLTWACPRFPSPGQTVIGVFKTGPGGKGSNQAVAARRAGAPTLFVGAVGRDGFAAAAKAFHKAEGIEAHHIVKLGHATATAGILVNKDGQNQIIVALGASATITPADVPPALLKGAGVAVCQHEATLAVNAHAFRIARRAGATTVLNPAPMRPDFDRRILALTDVLIPNESEFAALVPMIPAAARIVRTRPFRALGPWGDLALRKAAPQDLHRLCRATGVPTVILTLGERGCLVSVPSGWVHLPAFTGVKVVDTTGAGDAFVGGFAAGLLRYGGDVLRAARLANAVAALSVTRPGTAPSMPGHREIERFLTPRSGARSS